MEADLLDLEDDAPARLQPGANQVLDHLLLAVDRDRAPAAELAQGDAMAPPLEPQLEAVVDQPLAPQAVGYPGLREQIDRALLEDAGPHPLLDVVAAAVLQHDRVHALPGQQLGEDQPRRSRSDDRDLRAHPDHTSAHGPDQLAALHARCWLGPVRDRGRGSKLT